MESRFHLALPCLDLAETRAFYLDILDVAIGRQGERWIDVDLYGHQITFALAGDYSFDYRNYRFDEYTLPAFHFGVILDKTKWNDLYTKLSDLDLEITSQATYLENSSGEQYSFFVQDPNGYMVEFKSFKDDREIFHSL